MNDTHTHDIQSIQENIDDVGYVRSSDPTSPTQDTVPYWFELERERLQESLHIIIEDYPVHDFIKPRLLEIMNQAGFPNSQKTNVKADMTDWNIEAKDISIMHEWISSLIAPKMQNFDEDKMSKFVDEFRGLGVNIPPSLLQQYLFKYLDNPEDALENISDIKTIKQSCTTNTNRNENDKLYS